MNWVIRVWIWARVTYPYPNPNLFHQQKIADRQRCDRFNIRTNGGVHYTAGLPWHSTQDSIRQIWPVVSNSASLFDGLFYPLNLSDKTKPKSKSWPAMLEKFEFSAVLFRRPCWKTRVIFFFVVKALKRTPYHTYKTFYTTSVLLFAKPTMLTFSLDTMN